MARSASQRTLPEKPRALHERRRCRSSKPRRRRPGHPVGRTRATWGCVARPTGAPAVAGTARRSRRCQSRRRRATWRLPRLMKMCACVGEARGVHKHARVLIYTIRVLCMSLRSALNRPLPHLYDSHGPGGCTARLLAGAAYSGRPSYGGVHGVAPRRGPSCSTPRVLL